MHDARGSPYVDYYDATQFASPVDLGSKIQESMAQGKFAVVERYPTVPRIELSLESLFLNLGLVENERFEAHGALSVLRAADPTLTDTDAMKREVLFSDPYSRVTLKEFIDNMKDPALIQAILDSTAAGAHHYPILIRYASSLFSSALVHSLLGTLIRVMSPPTRRGIISTACPLIWRRLDCG